MSQLSYSRDLDDAAKLALADAMLDANLSDIAVLPDFVQLPKGQFLINEVITAEVGRNEEGMPVIKLVFSIGETIALAAFPNVSGADIPEENRPPVGSLVSYQFQGALGIQQFRKIFDQVSAQLGDMSTKAFIEALSFGQVQGMAFENGRRPDKEKKDINPATGQLEPVTYNQLLRVVMA